MKSIERWSKFFGLVRVTQSSNLVRIVGIDGMVMRKHLSILFESDQIAKMMFTSITDTSMTLHEFFIPDFLYMLKVFKEHPKCSWAARRTVDRIVAGILKNTWYAVTTKPYTPMVDPKKMDLLKWKPLPKQVEFLHAYGNILPKYDLKGYLLGVAPGGGKAQPLDAFVRTSEGWTLMQDVTTDTKVVCPDGTLASVVGVYPQGKKDIYRVTFEDGRKTECCEEHLWKVYSKDWKRTGNGWKVINLEEIISKLEMSSYKDRLYVELPSPEIKPDTVLPIDPYVLGILLGDGHIREGMTLLSTSDQFVVDEVTKLLSEDYELVKCGRSDQVSYDYRIVKKERSNRWHPAELMTDLRSLNLTGTHSHTKFIPDLYINASASQKLSLIQGLMDSDGTVSENGSTSLCTTSLKMAYQAQEILRSLGALVKISIKNPYFTYNGERKEGKRAYQLNIRIKDPKSLFRLSRKIDLCPSDYQYKDSLRLRICEIEYVGQKEAQCIAVDHPEHLYITDNYIVTHNTYADLLLATCVIPSSIAEVKIVISPKKAIHLVWEKTIKEVFKKPVTFWVCDSGIKMPMEKTEYYIFNFEALDKAIELGKHLTARGIKYFTIVDESHNFADYRSGRTQKLVQLQTIHKDNYFIWTSGSPILKSAAELSSFLKCSDPRFDADAERRFKRIFTAAPGRANEIFNHRLGQQMAFLVSKKDLNLTPPPTIKELPIKLPPSIAHKFLISSVRLEMKEFIEQRLEFYKTNIAEYRRIVSKWMDYHETKLKSRYDRKLFDVYQQNLKIIMRAPDLMLTETMAAARIYERTKLFPSLPATERRAFRNALSAVKNIKLKVRGEALGTILSKRRSECAAMLGIYCKPDEIMKESLSKTLFFASSVLPIQTLEKKLTVMGFEPLAVYADTNSQLVQMMERFDNDPNVNPICATMQSLSEAVPVISASTVVLLNRPFRQATFDQVIARADRLGQKYPVTIIEVTLDTGGEPNVSSTTDAILANVRELINDIVGSGFSGPSMDERQYKDVIDASKEDPVLLYHDEKLGL